MDLVKTNPGRIFSNILKDLHFKKELHISFSLSLLKLAQKHNRKSYEKF